MIIMIIIGIIYAVYMKHHPTCLSDDKLMVFFHSRNRHAKVSLKDGKPTYHRPAGADPTVQLANLSSVPIYYFMEAI